MIRLKKAASNMGITFLGDVLKLVSGTVVAQLILVLSSPILTRLYSPEAFGTLAIFVSITTILSVIACLRYELAIMLPSSHVEAANIFIISLLFAGIVSFVCAIVFSVLQTLVVRFLNADELGKYLWLIPWSVLFSGILLAMNYWNSRTRHFERLSFARMSQSLTTVLINLGLGFGGYNNSGALIGANVLGQVMASGLLGANIWRDDRLIFIKAINLGKMRELISRYRKFPLVDSWSGLLNTVSINLPALLLASFFSPSVVGFYSLGYRILNLPMTLVGSAIAQVFFQRASVAKTEGTLDNLVQGTFLKLVSLSAFPFTILVIAAPELFEFAFGRNWREAGHYVQILAPWLFFVFLSSPLSTLISVLEIQEVGLYFNIVLLLSRLISLVIGGIFQQVVLGLILYSLSGFFLWLWFTLFVITKTGVEVWFPVKIISKKILLTLLTCIPVLGAKILFPENLLAILFSMLVASLLYYLIAFKGLEKLVKLFVDRGILNS